MKRHHAAVAMLALSSIAVLPACSNWNGFGQTGSQPSSAAQMAPQELAPDTVKQVQTALQQQGMYKGNIDGVWGPATQSAVASYQQAHGMPASGKLDQATMASLNVGGGGSAASAAPPPAQQQSNAAPPPAAPAPPSPPAATGTTQP